MARRRFSPRDPDMRPLDDRLPTLAEMLASQGYFTAATVANFGIVSRHMGMARGFEVFASPMMIPPDYTLARAVRSILSFVGPMEMSRINNRAPDINRIADPVLRKAERQASPLFLYVNYMDAHAICLPPPPYDTLFPGHDGSFDPRRYYDVAHQVNAGSRRLNEDERADVVSQYDGSIRLIDDQIARLIGRLRELGRFDDALIIVTADHGEAFGEYGLLGHEASTRQDQVHVPLLIKYPHQTEPAVDPTVLSQVDLLPTILDTLKMAVPEGLDGSPVRLLRDTERIAVSECQASDVNNRLAGVQRSIRKDNMKLTTTTNGPTALYDLARDPNEQHNLFSGSESVDSSGLLTELDRWLAATPRYDPGGTPLDPEMVERLRSLGYVQ